MVTKTIMNLNEIDFDYIGSLSSFINSYKRSQDNKLDMLKDHVYNSKVPTDTIINYELVSSKLIQDFISVIDFNVPITKRISIAVELEIFPPSLFQSISHKKFDEIGSIGTSLLKDYMMHTSVENIFQTTNFNKLRKMILRSPNRDELLTLLFKEHSINLNEDNMNPTMRGCLIYLTRRFLDNYIYDSSNIHDINVKEDVDQFITLYQRVIIKENNYDLLELQETLFLTKNPEERLMAYEKMIAFMIYYERFISEFESYPGNTVYHEITLDKLERELNGFIFLDSKEVIVTRVTLLRQMFNNASISTLSLKLHSYKIK